MQEQSERFWSKVSPETSGCWLWTASLRNGYGQFHIGGRGMVRAHRWAYELLVAPIPSKLQPDHLCRVRHCVNPLHLELVTSATNTLRGTGPAAINAAKTHCKRGHSLANAPRERLSRTFFMRRCRVCTNELKRKRYASRKAA
jgi:hypothetical protein